MAGVTYRMLDHWHRQGWVTATRTERVGATRSVRRYDDVAVLQLGAMRHLARSGLDVARHGPDVGRVDLTGPVVMIVGGQPDAAVEVIAAGDVHDRVTVPGRWVVYDPEPLKAKLLASTATGGFVDGAASGDDRPASTRRSA